MTAPKRRTVLVIFTREGFEDIRALLVDCPTWVNANVLTNSEVEEFRAAGADLTRFTYEIPPNDDDAIVDVVGIIAEHHPGDRLWVEFQAGELDDSPL